MCTCTCVDAHAQVHVILQLAPCTVRTTLTRLLENVGVHCLATNLGRRVPLHTACTHTHIHAQHENVHKYVHTYIDTYIETYIP